MIEEVSATRRQKAASFCKEHWRKAGAAIVVIGVGGVALAVRDTPTGTKIAVPVAQAVVKEIAGTVTKGPANNPNQPTDPVTKRYVSIK